MVVQVDGGYSQLEILVLGALAAVAFIGLFLFVAYPYLSTGRRAVRWSRRKPFTVVQGATALGDSASQLRHVMGASFYKKKVMSKDEYKVFRIIETELQALRNGCRVLSQTSLGEIIGSDNEKAFASINSKRVDILVIAANGEPVAAVEYQGGGHHQGSSAARDAIKKEALRKAGVQFLEVVESHSQEEITLLVRKLFQQQQPSRPDGQRISA
jgi:Protein of unknown function (DUF2726)